MFLVIGILVFLEVTFVEAKVNIINFSYQKIHNEKPTVESSLVKPVPSVIMCSALCNRVKKCTGFGFQGPPETEYSECSIYEADELELTEADDENYRLYIKIKGVADEEPESNLIFVPEEKSWLDASEHCAIRYNGSLLLVTDDEAQKKLQSLLEETDKFDDSDAIWIGMHSFDTIDPGNEEFKWTNEFPLEQEDFTNWAEDEPSGGRLDRERCVAMFTANKGNEYFGKWADYNCGDDVKFPFICERGDLEYVRLMNPESAFDDAIKRCRADFGWRLAIIPDEETQQEIEKFLNNQYRSTNLWIGLTGTEKGEEAWLDNTKVSETKYTNWADGHPEYDSDSSKICFAINKNAKWVGLPCEPDALNPQLPQMLCQRIPSQ